MVSNRINFKRKKEEEELRKFIRSEEKSLALVETHNYKKFNELIKAKKTVGFATKKEI